MLESLSKTRNDSWVSSRALLSVGVFTGFFTLLLEGQIHPLIVYCLQLFLSL